MMRVGFGYDVHPLVMGRRLILGGAEVPFQRGLSGHSDADVLTHAIMDALLGAAGLGDIGQHFPPTNPQYKDASSIKLLRQVTSLITEKGWHVENLDATIVAERPRLAPFVRQMQQHVGEALGISPEQVGIKATTSEGLGFAGRGEGIAAYAVVLLGKISQSKP